MLRQVLFALAFLAGPAWAACTGENIIASMPEAERGELAARVARHPYPEGNFWRAEKTGSTVHVIGTFHLDDPRLGPFKDKVAPVIAGADILVMEMTEEAQGEMMRTMAESPEAIFIVEGPTLIDLLGDDWTAVAEAFASRGVPGFMAAKFQPWYAATMLSLPACIMSDLANVEGGFDRWIEGRAREAGLDRASLDSPDILSRLFGDLPLDSQVDMLRSALEYSDVLEAQFVTTADSYFAGRHRELWELAGLMLDEQTFADMDATLLTGRNREWETALPGLIDGRDAVIAVGAGHLSGETGVLRSLERMGYALSPF